MRLEAEAGILIGDKVLEETAMPWCDGLWPDGVVLPEDGVEVDSAEVWVLVEAVEEEEAVEVVADGPR